MGSFRASSTLPLFGFLVALAGCSGQAVATSGPESAEAAQAKETASTESSPQGRARIEIRRAPPGGTHLLTAALREPINLTPEQMTTIEAALAASEPQAPPMPDRSRIMALAAGVRAGKVDTSDGQAARTFALDGVSAHLAASAKALDTLHATLTKEQRRALVDAVSKRMAQHGPPDGAFGKMPPPGMDRHHPGGNHEGHGGPLWGLLEGLDLTKAQEDAIKAKIDADKPVVDHEAMKKVHEAVHAEMAARLPTFANDTFDATAFVAPPAAAPKPTIHVRHMADDLALITPILDAAQREKLAARIEQGPPARPEGAPARGFKQKRFSR